MTPPAGTAGAGSQDLDEVRLLLDAGDNAAAAAAIARLRAEGVGGARLFFLDAVCALGRGERDSAERLLRSALYLDGAFAMAHYLSAQSLMELGRPAAARRAFANAGNALADVPPDAPVPEGDGRTAAELREAVRARLAAIDAA